MSSRKGKPSKKVSSGRKARNPKRVPPHLLWEFRPKLQNEKVILHSILGVYSIEFYARIVNDIRELITQLVRSHGFNDGSQRYKTIKDYTIALIEGRNPENPGWLSTSRVHRIPSKLGISFIQLIADYFSITDPSLRGKYYQVINTTLNIVRMVDGLVDSDLRSVTEKAKRIDQELLDDFEQYARDRLACYRKEVRRPNLFNIRFNLKRNGPNSVPKLESALQEAVVLLNSKLARPFKVICQELNCEYLYDYLNLLVSNETSKPGYSTTTQLDTARTTHLRKLVDIPDSGFKTRMVAIVDFWSQLVLEPFRSNVQDVIERMYGKTDFRKSHDLGVAKMVEFQRRCLDNDVIEHGDRKITLDAKHLKFYDISSWTDKLHRDLQKIVVRNLYNPRMAEAWGQLVVHCDWYYPKLDSTIKYGQGQGMGTNGSFDIATLTDHLFINYVIDRQTSYRGVFPNNQCYGKVGDDLWIYDPEDQIRVFYGKIYLPINTSKSKEFNGTDSISEFCSRTFLNSHDVSRVNPKIISKSKDYRYMPILLGVCSSRGVQLDATSFETLNNTIGGTEETYLDKLQGWLVSMLLVATYENSSYFSALSLDYLETGNWIKGELISNFFNDPKLLTRIQIAYSIVQICENLESVEDKLFETVDAMFDFGDEVTRLTENGSNLFDPSNELYQVALTLVPDQVLTPRQIIVFGRYVDQRTYVQDRLQEANEFIMFSDDHKDIVRYAEKLIEIANKSCYDEGNINYDIVRIFNSQYKIVKVLERMDEDYMSLSGLSGSQLRSILQTIPYDAIASKWEGFLPTLLTD